MSDGYAVRNPIVEASDYNIRREYEFGVTGAGSSGETGMPNRGQTPNVSGPPVAQNPIVQNTPPEVRRKLRGTMLPVTPDKRSPSGTSARAKRSAQSEPDKRTQKRPEPKAKTVKKTASKRPSLQKQSPPVRTAKKQDAMRCHPRPKDNRPKGGGGGGRKGEWRGHWC